MSHYAHADDLLHRNDGDPLWQESHWLMWHDVSAGIGGLHRLAIHPVAGTTTFWCGVMASDGTRYRAEGWRLPRPEAAEGAFVVTPTQRLRFIDGELHLEVDEPGCEVHLAFAPFHPMARYMHGDIIPTAGAPDHFEAGGRVTGHCVLDGRRRDIDGLAFRDRSWGPRNYEVSLSHRWVAGTFGPELSFSAITVAAIDGSLLGDGIVIRDGQAHRAVDVDIVVHLEADGMTHRGGEVTLITASGEMLTVRCETIDATLFTVGDRGAYAGVDSICRAESEGRIGFCDLEVSNNPRRGRAMPLLALRANLVDGISRARG